MELCCKLDLQRCYNDHEQEWDDWEKKRELLCHKIFHLEDMLAGSLEEDCTESENARLRRQYLGETSPVACNDDSGEGDSEPANKRGTEATSHDARQLDMRQLRCASALLERQRRAAE